MKTVNARDLQKKIKQCVDVSQQDRIVITRRGKPTAVMVGSRRKGLGGSSAADVFELLEAR
jgi:prevent-host-death family protein